MGSDPRRDLAAPAVAEARLLGEEQTSVGLESSIVVHGNEAGDKQGSSLMRQKRNEH
jgi:hypothetical protein